MTAKQIILKSFYPFLQFINKKFKKNMQVSSAGIQSKTSFYDLEMKQNNGQVLSFQLLKGKKILLVNTASDCGYTAQYDGLEKLYIENKNDMVILAFPANDFGQQEKADDSAIEQFCKINYGITFPLMAKSSVVKGIDQNPVFKWLTDKNDNGWNDKAPSWNFWKYLVDKNGNLTYYFESAVEPTDNLILQAIK